ncbi:hypothetical protein D4R71_00310 [bacterium]|nr:MAG: hypothetical protein D4R71_00310 [bacterium]
MTKLYYKAGSVTIRDANMLDASNLASNMRQSDKSDIFNLTHKEPKRVLAEDYKKSIVCFTIERKRSPIAMFGIVPCTILGKTALVWLISTSEINKVKLIFKYSRKFIDLMLGYYSILSSYVDANDAQSIRWLKLCGAELGSIILYGAGQQPFQYFEFRRSDKW